MLLFFFPEAINLNQKLVELVLLRKVKVTVPQETFILE